MNKNFLSSQRGSVLWFILIAVVFTGLLTMALTRNTNSVEQTGNREQAVIKISQLTRYLGGIESAIETMRLSGISENEISFANGYTEADYTNERCASSSCLLFDGAGAGLSFLPVPSGLNDGSDWIFTGSNNVGTTADPIGTTEKRYGNDLIALMPGAKEFFCSVFNHQMGIAGGEIPVDNSGVLTSAYIGTFENVLNIIDGDGAPFELDGHKAGCFKDGKDEDRIYMYYVLHAR